MGERKRKIEIKFFENIGSGIEICIGFAGKSQELGNIRTMVAKQGSLLLLSIGWASERMLLGKWVVLSLTIINSIYVELLKNRQYALMSFSSSKHIASCGYLASAGHRKGEAYWQPYFYFLSWEVRLEGN